MAQQKLDIEQVVRDKAGDKARFVPGFVINYLRKIVHEDELNEFFAQSGDLEGVPWLDAAVDFVGVKLEARGEERLPDPADGRRYTFVSNHPLGGIDGISLGKILGHRYDGHIRYLVTDLLRNLKGLAPLCVGVNKFGAQGHDFTGAKIAAFGDAVFAPLMIEAIGSADASADNRSFREGVEFGLNLVVYIHLPYIVT